jgi:hypothetical protein
LFDDELRPRSPKGKVLGEPFSREKWNVAKREAKEPPLPKPNPDDPEEAPPPATGALVKDLLISAGKKKKKKKRDSSKVKHCCPVEGCKNQVWGRHGVPVGCFCGKNGGMFIPESVE